jgi:hypothetical protein
MIEAIEVPLALCLPSTCLGMVLAQPMIRLEEPPHEPFRWDPRAVSGQLEMISRTLHLAKEGVGSSKAHFTVFPEYSIPGHVGIAAVDQMVAATDWPNGTVVIGGVDGLSKREFLELYTAFEIQRISLDISTLVLDHEWINCSVIWVREDTGEVRRFLQPKIRPCWAEMRTSALNMFRGRWIYLFQAKYNQDNFPCNFLSLICFDWVASLAGRTICDEILDLLSNRWQGNPKPLHWVFVPQYNEEPNHPAFLQSTHTFLDSSHHPTVDRCHTCVVMANAAVQQSPCHSGRGGFSACIFGPGAPFDCRSCRPTVCMKPERLRNNARLNNYSDVVFREMGECIHAFTVRVPRFVRRDPTDHTFPIEDAIVYSASGHVEPRRPNAPVPAAVKWANDCIDVLDSLADTALSGRPLESEVRESQNSVTNQLRMVSQDLLMYRMSICSGHDYSISPDQKLESNVDLWGLSEESAIMAQVHGLSLLGVCGDLCVDKAVHHGVIRTPSGQFCSIAIIRAPTYEDCRKHFDKWVSKTIMDPVIFIAESDLPDSPVEQELRTIFDLHYKDSRIRPKAMVALRQACRLATTAADLRQNLNDIFEHRDAAII